MNAMKSIATGMKKHFGKAKDKAVDYAEKKIHDKKKDIALDVIDSTMDKVPAKQKMHLKASEELIEDKFAKGKTLKGKKKWIKPALSGKKGIVSKFAEKKGIIKAGKDLTLSSIRKVEKVATGKMKKRATMAETLIGFNKKRFGAEGMNVDGGITPKEFVENLKVGDEFVTLPEHLQTYRQSEKIYRVCKVTSIRDKRPESNNIAIGYKFDGGAGTINYRSEKDILKMNIVSLNGIDIVFKTSDVSDKYAKGGVAGDIYSIKNPEQFKQLITIYNDLSDKTDLIKGYYIDHTDNSIVFLTPPNISDVGKDKIYDYVELLKKKGFSVINFDKSIDTKKHEFGLHWGYEKSSQWFKLYLIDTIKYAKGSTIKGEEQTFFRVTFFDDYDMKYFDVEVRAENEEEAEKEAILKNNIYVGDGSHQHAIEFEKFTKISKFAKGSTVTTNEGVIESFLSDKKELKVGNLSTHYSTMGDVVLLRNYGTLIAKRKGKTVSISTKKYSVTTTKIQNMIERMANGMGLKVEKIGEDEFAHGGEMYAEGSTMENKKYKVVKIFRKSGRREILFKNLSKDEAMRTVNRYPSSNTSMVVFYEMFKTGGRIEDDFYEVYDEESGMSLLIQAVDQDDADSIAEDLDFNAFEDGDEVPYNWDEEYANGGGFISWEEVEKYQNKVRDILLKEYDEEYAINNFVENSSWLEIGLDEKWSPEKTASKFIVSEWAEDEYAKGGGVGEEIVCYTNEGDFAIYPIEIGKKYKITEQKTEGTDQYKTKYVRLDGFGDSWFEFDLFIPKYAKGVRLKPLPKGNKGLPKLPESVRNKMGYMENGSTIDGEKEVEYFTAEVYYYSNEISVYGFYRTGDASLTGMRFFSINFYKNKGDGLSFDEALKLSTFLVEQMNEKMASNTSKFRTGGVAGSKHVSVTKGYRLPHGYKAVKGSDKSYNYSKGRKGVKVDAGYRLPKGYEIVEGAYDMKYEHGTTLGDCWSCKLNSNEKEFACSVYNRMITGHPFCNEETLKNCDKKHLLNAIEKNMNSFSNEGKKLATSIVEKIK
jgi:hypothetical protein